MTSIYWIVGCVEVRGIASLTRLAWLTVTGVVIVFSLVGRVLTFSGASVWVFGVVVSLTILTSPAIEMAERTSREDV
jgi:hypothetical protein